MYQVLVFLILGAGAGFVSGLLGVGGALVSIPLMLAVPQVCGLEALSMQDAAGLSMIQVLAASFSGVLQHRRNRFVNLPLLLTLGVSMALLALVGAVLAKFVSELILMLVFGVMALASGAMMFFPSPSPVVSETPDKRPAFSRSLALLLGAWVGLVAGMVGAGGGFMMVPLMVYVLRIPVKIAIGTSLGVVCIGAISGGLGKILTGQVLWLPVLGLVIGSVLTAQYGAVVSKKAPDRVLHWLLLAAVLLACLQIWVRILTGLR